MTYPAQRSFAGGELAPALYAKTDQNKYAFGLRVCRNMIVQRHGGATNRPGTEFATEVKNSANRVRLIPFERTASDAFALEFGNLYVRFLKNGAYIRAVGASGWVFPFFYTRGDVALVGAAAFVNITGNAPNISPHLDPTNWYPLTGVAAAAIYELPTPYLTADLPEIRYAQRSEITLAFGAANGERGVILALTHPSYAPRELHSISDQYWAFMTPSFAPLVGTPTVLLLGGGAVGAHRWWAVTAISENGEESDTLLGDGIDLIPSAGTPTTLSWTAPAAYPPVTSYRIYRSDDGVSYGFIGRSTGTNFNDVGVDADYLSPPPTLRDLFDATDKYPTAVTHYQQRLTLGNSNQEQETIWMSRSTRYTNFAVSFPLQADDAVTFTTIGKKLNSVLHLLDLQRLIAFTANEEKMIEGDDAGIIRPDAVNPRKLSSHGIGTLRPLEVDDSAIYVQARGTIVRDLKPVSADSYQGSDLSVFASHLFLGYEVVDWDYSESPNSIVWAVRSDGLLLGLTYLREHDIWGWHRHDTDGVVENVCVVPEGDEDRLYLVVRRTIDGATKRYIERMTSRYFVFQENGIFMDSTITYDGWNLLPTTIILSTAGTWTETDLLSAGASAGIFAAGDVGNVIIFQILDADGEETDRIRFTITSFTSANIVQGFSDRPVPAGLQGIATAIWALARKTLTGFDHLEGKTLAVLGDGYVVASPNNADPVLGYPEVTVSGGQITLPAPYAVIHAGLPYISDLVTLDLDLAGGQTIKNQKMLINRLGIYVEASRGIWAGMPDQPTEDEPLRGLQEYKARSEEDYDDPVTPKTDYIEIGIEARADENGRVMIRQVDPLPITVLAIMPMVK